MHVRKPTNALSGNQLLRHLLGAVTEARKHRRLHTEFTATFLAENVARWSTMVDAWNEDPFSAPDPYQEVEPGEYVL